ncbi:MAG: efflux RND transporter periplasmic adaptor subunit [Campylobacterota bacterium]|nr:efflux RND transporter periplasmic adaptor subunit [Campylobacterota bacterium]
MTLKKPCIALFSALILLTGCSDNKQPVKAAEAPPLPVEIVTVKNQNIPIWMPYTGKTQASSSQEVRARVTGILEEIYYKDGDHVKKGQNLFKIEQDDYIAALDAAKAKKRRDLASLKLAEADVNRYAPLVQEGLAPRVTLEQYEAQVEALKADIVSDDAAIRQADLELSYTIVKAPIDGQASRRLVDIGNLVGKSEATLLTTINKTDPLYAYFAPSEEQFQQMSQFRTKNVMDAYIEINYQSKMLKSEPIFGHVNFSDNTVDPATSTVSMRVEIPNPKQNIFPGTFVYVNVFVTDKFRLMGVPPQIIFEDQRGYYLYVVDEQQSAQRVYIKPAFESRHFTLFKADTLKDGDKVIINALMRLKPGLKVTPTDVTETKGLDAVIKENNLLPTMPERKE